MSFGTNKPQGLVPVCYMDGSPYTGAQSPYPIASGYGTSIFNGDPVAMLSDGTIGIGVAGARARGVFQGCKYTATTGEFIFSAYWPASTTVMTGTTVEAMIADDPNLMFSVQETSGTGTAGTPIALTDMGLNINFLIGSGSTATGQSTTSLDNSTEATTFTLNLKLVRLDPHVGNVVGAFANYLVAWNTHDFRGSGTTGV